MKNITKNWKTFNLS